MCFEKMQWSISETVIARAFKPLSLCSAPLKNLVVGITGALEMKETHFLSKIYFQKMQWSISETVNARAFKPLSLCSAPLKT